MAVIPKPASTVVLMDHLSRVYMTKRPKTMRAFGGFFVFPGGVVEETDNIIEKELIKGWKPNESFKNDHYITAARELFEEVGVLLANNGDGLPVHLKKEIEMEYRRLLVKGDISFLEMLKQEKLYLNLINLKYFGSLTTSKERPYRFNTKFFLAKLPKGQSPTPDRYEIDEAFWITPAEALDAYKRGEIPMVPPTISSLQAIKKYQNGGPLKLKRYKIGGTT